MFIVEHGDGGQSERYQEVFHAGFFSVDAAGNLDVVLHRKKPVGLSQEEEPEQIVHIRTLWNSVPGRTIAESTQLNAQVVYAIASVNRGTTFEGSGSLVIHKKKNRDLLIGEIDAVTLTPGRELGSGAGLFNHATLSGRFRAQYDSRQTTRLINQITQQFGPMLRYQPFRTGEHKSR